LVATVSSSDDHFDLLRNVTPFQTRRAGYKIIQDKQFEIFESSDCKDDAPRQNSETGIAPRSQNRRNLELV
jgi:hypothetical protein